MLRTFQIFAYLAFLAAFLYFVALLTGFVPVRSSDRVIISLSIDVGLVVFFGVIHSLMARSWFKRWWTTIIPAAAERSVYVLVASAQVALLCWQWRAVPGPVLWSLPGALVAVQLAGFGIALTSTFLIDHFELFGLRRPRAAAPFRTPLLYRAVRHPLYFGLLVAFWATPEMTPGRLVLCAGLTLYVVVGALFEERDLVLAFGDTYRRYQREVPMLLPLSAIMKPWRRGSGSCADGKGTASPSPSTAPGRRSSSPHGG